MSDDLLSIVLRIDHKVDLLNQSLAHVDERVVDHEARIRSIEAQEDLSRRVMDMEAKLDLIRQRVWAFPSLAGVAAIVAIVVAVSR